jgi:ligand-binding sensor domain-containing protein
VSEKFRETISSFFLVSAAQQFYIENNKTLVEVNNRSRQQISLMGLDNFELRVLFIEDRNNILVGTNQGLVCVKKNERPLYAIDDNQPSSVNQIRIRRKIVEDEKKQLILLGHPYSYLYGSDARFQNILNAPFSMYDAVLVDDFIYVTTDGRGLRKINIKNHLNDSITGWPFTPDGSYCSIYYDSITADLYVGDIGKLIIYNIRSNQRTFIPLPRNNAIIRAIRKDTSNHIFWIGTDKGLLMVNKEKKWVVPFRSNKSTISERKINDLLIRRNTSELWVAHDGGVDVIDLKTKTVLKRLPGYMFINPKTVSLVESNHGSIWMGTYVGIIGYEPKSDRFIRLGQNNGLVNKEFNHKSATKLSSGDLIFGGLSGYDVLNPDKYVFMN